jgi:hypothetical protein
LLPKAAEPIRMILEDKYITAELLLLSVSQQKETICSMVSSICRKWAVIDYSLLKIEVKGLVINFLAVPSSLKQAVR